MYEPPTNSGKRNREILDFLLLVCRKSGGKVRPSRLPQIYVDGTLIKPWLEPGRLVEPGALLSFLQQHGRLAKAFLFHLLGRHLAQVNHLGVTVPLACLPATSIHDHHRAEAKNVDWARYEPLEQTGAARDREPAHGFFVIKCCGYRGDHQHTSD